MKEKRCNGGSALHRFWLECIISVVVLLGIEALTISDNKNKSFASSLMQKLHRVNGSKPKFLSKYPIEGSRYKTAADSRLFFFTDFGDEEISDDGDIDTWYQAKSFQYGENENHCLHMRKKRPQDDFSSGTDNIFYEQYPQESLTSLADEYPTTEKETEMFLDKKIVKRAPFENVEKEYKKLLQWEKEWRETFREIRQDALENRKLYRTVESRKQLEEKAFFFALRALKLQSMVADSSAYNSRRPVLTLSSVSSPLYKRRGEDMYDLERKLYGKRFKIAFKVYKRLLETLEEMKVNSRQGAIDFLNERAASKAANDSRLLSQQPVVGQDQSENDKSKKFTANPQTLVRDEYINKAIQTNKLQYTRLSNIVTLAIHGEKLFGEVPKLNASGMAKSSSLKAIKLDDIDTADLVLILKIRGNVKQQGRLPKKRQKVLQLLSKSFSKELF